ncbi:MAG: ATP-binding protein [Acidimicrobiales bacterium]
MTTPRLRLLTATRALARRHWHQLSLQAYLLGLLALFALASGLAVAAERQRNLNRAEEAAAQLVELQASTAGRRISEALSLTQDGVAEVAANPALAALFSKPTPPGCALTFTGAGPFGTGHIDIIDVDGNVLCSSEPLPPPGLYSDAPWLDAAAEEAAIVGPATDPASGEEVLVVSAPITGKGTVVTFLVVDSVNEQLETNLLSTQPVRFELTDDPTRRSADLIVGSAAVEPIGWTVEAEIDRDQALALAQRDNQRLLLSLLAGMIVLLAATHLIYRGLARPIQRLSAAVRNGPLQSEITIVTGPTEVVLLAEDIAELRRNVATELAAREQAEGDLARSLESYRSLFAANPLPMWVYDNETLRFLDVNETAVATYGYSREEFLGMTIRDIRPAEDVPALIESARHAPPRERSGPWRHLLKDGTTIDVEITSQDVDFADHRGRFVMAEDVTQRERTRRLAERTERMDSLGQLAGGIAHDFNNVLAVILNYADFSAEELAAAAVSDPDRWAPVLRDVEQITVAGRRAAELTAQLLAFARGESAEIGPVDLNVVAREAEDLLHRTIGEQVDLSVVLEPALWAVTGNASQFAQVIINLAVNARDAMPAGGRLVIETSNVDVDEDQLQTRPELQPGRYVRLRVSDTGIGMDDAARDHAFEPFFTTKAQGSGTGLGLATVYGIVSRASGFVHLYSEPGLGTTVTALLPASDASIPDRPLTPTASRTTGTETILVVEDDDDLRTVTERILRDAGYQVLGASSGAAAVEVVRAYTEEIHLLLTDVVMPGMLGADLALQLHQDDPRLRVLFMSGYAPPLLLAGGTLPFGAPLVDKPFSASLLTTRVREILEAPAPPPHDHN